MVSATNFWSEQAARCQHLRYVTIDLDLAPAFDQLSLLVDQECTAFNAEIFSPIQFFELDNAEQAAQRFFIIGDEVEGKVVFAFEVLVGFQAVAGDAEQGTTRGRIGGVSVTKRCSFLSATRRVVFGVEIKHGVVPQQAVCGDTTVTGGLSSEGRQFLSVLQDRHDQTKAGKGNSRVDGLSMHSKGQVSWNAGFLVR